VGDLGEFCRRRVKRAKGDNEGKTERRGERVWLDETSVVDPPSPII
jgi:hypothetical protein